MENFTPFTALAGGLLIGLSAMLLFVFNGHIAGISGIAGELMKPQRGDVGWRVWFLGGLIVGGLAMAAVDPTGFAIELDRPIWAFVVSGLLVGYGTRLGNGCTSGHGVCGIARVSPRSILATVTFMIVGFITVYLVEHVVGIW